MLFGRIFDDGLLILLEAAASGGASCGAEMGSMRPLGEMVDSLTKPGFGWFGRKPVFAVR